MTSSPSPCRCLTASDDDFECFASLWNADVTARPSVLFLPASVTELALLLRSRPPSLDEGYTVRGGGHSVRGASVSNGRPMISLARLRSVVWHDDLSVVDVGGGCLASDLISRTDLTVVMALISTTGMGGLLLGGGVGWLSRRFGLAVESNAQRHAAHSLRERESRSVLGAARWRRRRGFDCHALSAAHICCAVCRCRLSDMV